MSNAYVKSNDKTWTNWFTSSSSILCAALHSTAEEVLGIEKRRKNRWISDTTFKLADEKAKAKCDSRERERYCNLCSATKRSAKIDKERWIEEQCKNIQQCYFGERKMREAYRLP